MIGNFQDGAMPEKSSSAPVGGFSTNRKEWNGI